MLSEFCLPLFIGGPLLRHACSIRKNSRTLYRTTLLYHYSINTLNYYCTVVYQVLTAIALLLLLLRCILRPGSFFVLLLYFSVLLCTNCIELY